MNVLRSTEYDITVVTSTRYKVLSHTCCFSNRAWKIGPMGCVIFLRGLSIFISRSAVCSCRRLALLSLSHTRISFSCDFPPITAVVTNPHFSRWRNFSSSASLTFALLLLWRVAPVSSTPPPSSLPPLPTPPWPPLPPSPAAADSAPARGNRSSGDFCLLDAHGRNAAAAEAARC